MNPEISWIGSGISIDKESQLGFPGRKIDMIILDDLETPVPKIRPTPQVGHTCMIRHQVKRNSAGDAVGLNRLDRPVRVAITAVYLDGTVRTGISDMWEVQIAGTDTWETINPLQNRSE